MSDTPRTDEQVLAWQTADGSDMCQASFARQLERELTQARNEIARLNGQTRWQCSCGGTDCEGQRENEELRTQLDRLRTALEERTDAYNIVGEERDLLRTKLQHANEAALRAINAKASLIADNARLIAENKRLYDELHGKDAK